VRSRSVSKNRLGGLSYIRRIDPRADDFRRNSLLDCQCDIIEKCVGANVGAGENVGVLRPEWTGLRLCVGNRPNAASTAGIITCMVVYQVSHDLYLLRIIAL
jgi:hypothetical protein